MIEIILIYIYLFRNVKHVWLFVTKLLCNYLDTFMSHQIGSTDLLFYYLTIFIKIYTATLIQSSFAKNIVKE